MRRWEKSMKVFHYCGLVCSVFHFREQSQQTEYYN